MTYNEFRAKVNKLPIIFSRDITMHRSDKQAMRNQLNRWHHKGLLIELKRGIFFLNANDRKITPARAYIANQLYVPSYVSLEYALAYYGLIPERVNDLTSVTTKKTVKINNQLAAFVYQHIKPKAFRGFKGVKDETGLTFFMAEPEKAIIDFCYLNLKHFKGDYRAVLKESYRLQNLESLKPKIVVSFAKHFSNNKLMCISKSLCEIIKEERRKR